MKLNKKLECTDEIIRVLNDSRIRYLYKESMFLEYEGQYKDERYTPPHFSFEIILPMKKLVKWELMQTMGVSSKRVEYLSSETKYRRALGNIVLNLTNSNENIELCYGYATLVYADIKTNRNYKLYMDVGLVTIIDKITPRNINVYSR